MEKSDPRKVCGGEGAKEEEVAITCPACSQTVKVPPEGVEKFQTNFYLDDGGSSHVQPLLCEVCDQGQGASHCCTRCQLKLCYHCHRAHTPCPQSLTTTASASSKGAKMTTTTTSTTRVGEMTKLLECGRKQVEALSSVLAREAEEGQQLQQQQAGIVERVDSLYAAGVACLTEARDHLLHTITHHTRSRQAALDSEMAEVRVKHDTLAALTAGQDCSSVTEDDLNSALMADVELSKLQARSAGKTPQFFTLTPSGKTSSQLVHTMGEAVFGTLTLGPPAKDGPLTSGHEGGAGESEGNDSGCSPLASADSGCSPLMSLSSLQQQAGLLNSSHSDDGDTMTSRLDDLAQKLQMTLSKVKESESRERQIRVEMRNLREEFKIAEEKNSLLIAVIQSENNQLKEDVSQLQISQERLAQSKAGSEQGTLGSAAPASATMSTTSAETARQIEQLRKDVRSVKDAQRNAQMACKRGMQDLQSKIGKTMEPVYFKAVLDRKVTTTNSIRPLVCSNVDSNRGGGYDESSGKFLAPVSGTYLILVTVGPHHSDKAAKVEIVREKFHYHGTVTCDQLNETRFEYRVLNLREGESIWLETYDVPSSFQKDLTSFSGVLLMPFQ